MITTRNIHRQVALLLSLTMGFIFGSFAATGEEPLSKICFGSCAKQDEPQPIWDAIVAQNPELFVFLGDNIYANTRDMNIMRAKYAQLAAIPGFQKLRSACPIIA